LLHSFEIVNLVEDVVIPFTEAGWVIFDGFVETSEGVVEVRFCLDSRNDGVKADIETSDVFKVIITSVLFTKTCGISSLTEA